MAIYSIILAAGEGKRMKSKTAKPLQKLCGKTLVEWVINEAEAAGSAENVIVIGHKAEDVRAYLGEDVQYAYQYEQLGTGHAVMQGIEPLKDKSGTVMVLYGDTPLISSDTLKKVYEEHISNNRAATVITAIAENPFGYGRIVRENGEICRIVEQKDASDEQKKICEINSGMYFFELDELKAALSKITNDNNQNEYYITDTIEILLSEGKTVGTYTADFEETLGVNDRVQLSQVEKILNAKLVKEAMLGGVTIIDPNSVYISAEAEIGMDTVIYPNTVIEGKTVIGEDCIIGPGTTLRNTKIGNGTEVINSVAVDSEVGDNTHVGPFAYLRPNSKVGNEVKIGDFVEIKNSNIGNGTKVSHLTYIGDADVGSCVNFGCGTVVVNYDGESKHRSVIEDNAFIGCNSNLVSPVRVEKGAYTAAGSTITDNVPEGALAIARSKQVVKENWTEKKKNTKKKK